MALRYPTALGIKAIFSTLKWPQGNVEVERFMQPLGNSLTASKLYGRAWKDDRQGMSSNQNDMARKFSRRESDKKGE
ncbi:Hypothetical predicted protein [Paramuricea clavata]|uniref:Uncharacterized protein n=1 Tax=Paramuricea clavata TaxID=317549 RepID=A0A7D9K259_PARCT|nr:Hypothetical predicted protein [Paramuricea clavata]